MSFYTAPHQIAKCQSLKVLKFVHGIWIGSKSGHEDDGMLKLLTLNKKLEEEKMMLNVKLEICMDLLSETIVEKESIQQ